jgi:hypothetical protein
MNVLTNIQAMFNSREIALFFWIALIVLAVLFSNHRKSLVSIFNILKRTKFLIIFSLIGAYLYGIISLLKILEFWQTSNLKDVMFWLFSVGLFLVFKINEVKNITYFKEILLAAIKWTILLEFINNLYSFSQIIEIIILPVFVFLGIKQAVKEMDEKHKMDLNFSRNVIAVTGLLIFSFSLYKTIINFDEVFTFQNLFVLLLPSIITILFIPFVYFLALYSTYESYFIYLDSMTVKKDKVKEIRKLIFRSANFNLDKLLRIERNFEKRVFYDDTVLKDYVQEISK